MNRDTLLAVVLAFGFLSGVATHWIASSPRGQCRSTPGVELPDEFTVNYPVPGDEGHRRVNVDLVVCRVTEGGAVIHDRTSGPDLDSGDVWTIRVGTKTYQARAR